MAISYRFVDPSKQLQPGGSGGSLDFFSDWSYATGQSDDAYLDGPAGSRKWDGYLTNDTDIGQVLSASGLGFPGDMSNVYSWTYTPAASPDALQVDVANGWPLPAVGEFIFHRFYIRCDFPDGFEPGAVQHFYHIGDDSNGYYEACYSITGMESGLGAVDGGQYRVQMLPNWLNTPYSEVGYYNHYLTVEEVYRFELRIERVATNEVRYTSRCYNSAGTLLDSSPDEVLWEYYGSSGWTDLPQFEALSTSPDDHLRGLEIGNNDSEPTGTFTPTPTAYFGGLAIRVTSDGNDWIGAYPVTGVED